MKSTQLFFLIYFLLFTSLFASTVTAQSYPFESQSIGDISVRIILGDITSIEVDAYVVPHFQSAASYGGVGGAVARAGGKTGIDEFDLYVGKQGTLDFGTVHITESGGGNSNYLINVVSVGSGFENEFRVVAETVYNALVEAQKTGIKSIAAPALGTGIIGALTSEQSAKAMLMGVDRFVNEGGKMDNFSIVIYGDRNAYSSFSEVLKRKTYLLSKEEAGKKGFDPDKWVIEMNRDAELNAKVFAKDRTAEDRPRRTDELLSEHDMARVKEILNEDAEVSDVSTGTHRTSELPPDFEMRKRYIEALGYALKASPENVNQVINQAFGTSYEYIKRIPLKNLSEMSYNDGHFCIDLGRIFLKGSGFESLDYTVGARISSLVREPLSSGSFTNLASWIDYWTDGTRGDAFREALGTANLPTSQVFDAVADDDLTAEQASARQGELVSDEDKASENKALAKMTTEEKVKYQKLRALGRSIKEAIRKVFKK
jgi:O-acetyl-ADP-ribose deacetylase